MTEQNEAAPKAPRARASAKQESTSPSIYERINLISKEAGALAPEAKGGVPFPFRGIDSTIAHLTPYLNKYGVFLVPQLQGKNVSEREILNVNKSTGEIVPSGRIVKTTDLEVSYDVYGPDGYGFTVTVPGLADDFADRSTAQAMSVAYRIALLQLFHLPTHSKEPEETGEEVLKASGSAAAETAPNKAIEAARPAGKAATASNVKRLQQQAKALGSNLGKEPADLNALGSELSGGKGVDEWFNDAEVMGKLVAALQEEADKK